MAKPFRILRSPVVLTYGHLAGMLLATVAACVVCHGITRSACQAELPAKPDYVKDPDYTGYRSPWWFVHYKTSKVDERADTFSHYAQFADQRSKEPNWRDPADKKTQAVSGPSSELQNIQPLVDFLLNFIQEHSISSMVEASAGHWPSGWQSKVSWPPIAYTGVDLLQEMVDANQNFLQGNAVGFSSFKTMRADMTLTPLPQADLLLTKDTLQHMPNVDIFRYLIRQQLLTASGERRFKYVIFANVWCTASEYPNHDIPQEEHACQCIDLAAEPFNLPVETVSLPCEPPCNTGRVQVLKMI
ncbi:unnamed protein product [Symbiodinium natans]|uniref:Methyltransferase domain-containing protein n=1 Tax=Symbiodinium natans TaxID=878477 RepID=A0A812JF32_9DINO|nr:unnamed protein product [Symbiodinium natans]